MAEAAELARGHGGLSAEQLAAFPGGAAYLELDPGIWATALLMLLLQNLLCGAGLTFNEFRMCLLPEMKYGLCQLSLACTWLHVWKLGLLSTVL